MLSRLAFWCLLPVCAIQGLALRKKALRLPPPEGTASGTVGLSAHNRFRKPLHLLAIGDSIIAGIGASSQQTGLPARFAEALAHQSGTPVRWIAVGNSGSNSFDLLRMLDAAEPVPAPQVVLISIGVNDVTGLHSSRAWKNNLDALCEKMGSMWPEALVVFAGLPPMEKFPLPPQPLRFCLGLRAANFDRIASLVIDNHARMLHIPTSIDPAEHDFCADGFHPSDGAYVSWGSGLADRVYRYCPDIYRSYPK